MSRELSGEMLEILSGRCQENEWELGRILGIFKKIKGSLHFFDWNLVKFCNGLAD